MSVCNQHQSLQSCSTLNLQKRDIASEAYQSAIAAIEKDVKCSNELITLYKKQGQSIEGVHDVIKQAQAKYEGKSNNSKPLKWLRKLSSRITHYGQVLDVLAQHHPEYVALAWGALKFIFIGILNYERLVQEFSKALTKIGDVLSNMKIVAGLYQSDDMRDGIARLYEQIMRFLIRALKWYDKGRIRRVASSLVSPYELEYKDTVEQIEECAATVRHLANSKSQAEIRDLSLSMEIVRQEQIKLVEKVDTMVKIAECTKSLTERVDINVQDMTPRVQDLQFKDILSSLKPKFCPHESFRTLSSIVARSRTRRIPQIEPKDVFQSLNTWLTKEGSSLFILRVGPRAEPKAREVTTDMITMLREKNCHVIWRLSPPPTESEPSFLHETFTDVIKTLLHQIITLYPSLLESHELNAAKISSSHTDSEWISLIHYCFSRISKCYVIIEAKDLFQYEEGHAEWITGLLKVFKELAIESTGQGHVLKFLVLCYSNQMETLEGIGDMTTLLRKPTVIPMSRKHTALHKKGVKGWTRVTPKL